MLDFIAVRFCALCEFRRSATSSLVAYANSISVQFDWFLGRVAGPAWRVQRHAAHCGLILAGLLISIVVRELSILTVAEALVLYMLGGTDNTEEPLSVLCDAHEHSAESGFNLCAVLAPPA